MCERSDCAAHNRLDTLPEVVDGPFHATTYVGDKLVFTCDNPKFIDPLSALVETLGGNPPKIFVTYVLQLESDTASAAHLMEVTEEEYGRAILFQETHTDFTDEDDRVIVAKEKTPEEVLTPKVHDFHNMVVESVKSGLIGASA